MYIISSPSVSQSVSRDVFDKSLLPSCLTTPNLTTTTFLSHVFFPPFFLLEIRPIVQSIDENQSKEEKKKNHVILPLRRRVARQDKAHQYKIRGLIKRPVHLGRRPATQPPSPHPCPLESATPWHNSLETQSV